MAPTQHPLLVAFAHLQSTAEATNQTALCTSPLLCKTGGAWRWAKTRAWRGGGGEPLQKRQRQRGSWSRGADNRRQRVGSSRPVMPLPITLCQALGPATTTEALTHNAFGGQFTHGVSSSPPRTLRLSQLQPSPLAQWVQSSHSADGACLVGPGLPWPGEMISLPAPQTPSCTEYGYWYEQSTNGKAMDQRTRQAPSLAKAVWRFTPSHVSLCRDSELGSTAPTVCSSPSSWR